MGDIPELLRKFSELVCPAHRYALLEKEVGERERVAGDRALWLKFLNDSCLRLTQAMMKETALLSQETQT